MIIFIFGMKTCNMRDREKKAISRILFTFAHTHRQKSN